jgi:hypothetical protein
MVPFDSLGLESAEAKGGEPSDECNRNCCGEHRILDIEAEG